MTRKHIGKHGKKNRPVVAKRPRPKKAGAEQTPATPAQEPAPKPAFLAPAHSFGANLSTEISPIAD